MSQITVATLGLSSVVTSSSPSLWYLNRATGAVSLLLLSSVLVLGIVVRRGRPLRGTPRFVTAALHRNLSLLALAFLVVHIATAVLDPYVVLDVADVVVPFGAGYRPLWVGLGAASLDLLLAVALTSLLRQRIGHRAWRAVHWAAYACWPLAVAHGLGTGTDIGAWWMVALNALCVTAVLGSVGWRLTSGFRTPDLLLPPSNTSLAPDASGQSTREQVSAR